MKKGFHSIQAADGRYWHGPEKDSGATWGAAAEAWLSPSPYAAQRALEELLCPSAVDAVVVPAPPAALVGGAPAEATDGELEASVPASEGGRRKLVLRIRGRSDR